MDFSDRKKYVFTRYNKLKVSKKRGVEIDLLRDTDKVCLSPLKPKTRRNIFPAIKKVLLSPSRNGFLSSIFQFVFIGVFSVFLLNIFVVFTGALNKKDSVKGYNIKDILYSAESLRFSEALKSISEIESFFIETKDAISVLSKSTQLKLDDNSFLKGATLLLDTGELISKASKEMVIIINDIFSINIFDNTEKITFINNLFGRLELISSYLDISITNIEGFDINILPKDIKEKVLGVYDKTKEMKLYLDVIISNKQYLLKILGYPHPQRYMVVFQNNNEIRPTGGFIGSFLLFTLNDGVIEDIKFKDVYEIDNQLLDPLKSPKGLDTISEFWGMRDANYSPDFPTSVQNILWFLDKGKGPTVNSVVLLDQTVVEEILGLTGPIYLKDYGLSLDKTNFSFVLSYIVESKILGSKTPKKIIDDLIPVVVSKISDGCDTKKFIDLFLSLKDRKHITFYYDDEYIQDILAIYGLSGAVLNVLPNQDYLQMVLTSVSGNKSDAFIRYNLVHLSEISATGEIINTIRLKREHTWSKENEEFFNNMIIKFGLKNIAIEDLRAILGKGPNKMFFRFYVPKGSEVLGASMPIESLDDLDKTVFSFISKDIYPGEEDYIEIRYKLPFVNKADLYKMFIEKQIGMYGIDLNKIVKINGGIPVLDDKLVFDRDINYEIRLKNFAPVFPIYK